MPKKEPKGKIEEQTFVCLDCESTGLDPENDLVIEVAAVRFTLTDVLDSFETLVNPQIPIPESSIAIHHITDEMVQAKPLVKQVLPDLLAFVGNDIIVGHGIQFDTKLISAEAARLGIPCTIGKNLFLDTLRMARLYGESPKNSLQKLREHFNIDEEGAHRAMNDVLVNMAVFKHLAKEYRTIDQLFKKLSKPILMKTMPLGKHKGRPMRDIPLSYLQWAANKDFDEDLLYTIRMEIRRRKKGNMFEQAANPFGDL